VLQRLLPLADDDTGFLRGLADLTLRNWNGIEVGRLDLKALSNPPGRTAPAQACLILYCGEDAGKRFALAGVNMTLGRSPECDICIESPSVSRRHAELRAQGDVFVLHECGSANGTYVNSRRIDSPTVLLDGDVLRLGHMALKFYAQQSMDALLHDRIYRMATVDEGTDVFTKRYLLEALEREIRRAHRTGRPLSLVCLDLDHFKQVNDQFGHNGGDQVLQAVAAAVKAQLRGCDILGRMGGEEFAVVLPETDLRTAAALAERMRQAMAAQPHALELRGDQGQRTVVQHQQTASIGVARLEPDMADGRRPAGRRGSQALQRQARRGAIAWPVEAVAAGSGLAVVAVFHESWAAAQGFVIAPHSRQIGPLSWPRSRPGRCAPGSCRTSAMKA
jgi:two-component system cell cycle response regulator